jgi:hypothetical protein
LNRKIREREEYAEIAEQIAMDRARLESGFASHEEKETDLDEPSLEQVSKKIVLHQSVLHEKAL